MLYPKRAGAATFPGPRTLHDFSIPVIGNILNGPMRSPFAANEPRESPPLRRVGFGIWNLARRELDLQGNYR